MHRAAFTRDSRIGVIRISTDIEINANVKAQRLSVVGKDIRCTISSDVTDIIVCRLCRRRSQFPARAVGSSPRSARSESRYAPRLTVDRNTHAWQAYSDGRSV